MLLFSCPLLTLVAPNNLLPRKESEATHIRPGPELHFRQKQSKWKATIGCLLLHCSVFTLRWSLMTFLRISYTFASPIRLSLTTLTELHSVVLPLFFIQFSYSPLLSLQSPLGHLMFVHHFLLCFLPFSLFIPFLSARSFYRGLFVVRIKQSPLFFFFYFFFTFA